MPERSLKVIIRNGTVRVLSTRRGGQSCPVVLISGPSAFDPDDISYEEEGTWYDEVWAEGGYLADFDRRCLLVFSWDDAFMEATLPQIEAAWPGWSVQEATNGPPDFERHLAAAGWTPDQPTA